MHRVKKNDKDCYQILVKVCLRHLTLQQCLTNNQKEVRKTLLDKMRVVFSLEPTESAS